MNANRNRGFSEDTIPPKTAMETDKIPDIEN
jgi:hypothetical protein